MELRDRLSSLFGIDRMFVGFKKPKAFFILCFIDADVFIEIDYKTACFFLSKKDQFQLISIDHCKKIKIPNWIIGIDKTIKEGKALSKEKIIDKMEILIWSICSEEVFSIDSRIWNDNGLMIYLKTKMGEPLGCMSFFDMLDES